MSSQPNTPPSRAHVDEALARLAIHVGPDSSIGAFAEDLAVVRAEVTRLRRHSDALARVLGDVTITPTDPDDVPTANVFQRILRVMMGDPVELDKAAEAILRSPRT